MSGNTVYILLFRGVGGATQLPAAPLRAALAEAGFENVATWINSGNAIVRSPLARGQVIGRVAEIAARQFAFTKAIYAPTRAEWSALIAANPFPQAAATPKFLHAAWLAEQPQASAIGAVQALADNGDQFAVIGNVAWLHTPRGFSQSKMAERFDKLIGVGNTARNWNTVLKLQELALKAQTSS
jgi:uncharacterized protein (DUF1697 family)